MSTVCHARVKTLNRNKIVTFLPKKLSNRMSETDLEEFKKSLITEAENLIKLSIPGKIMELNKIIGNVLGSTSVKDIRQELNIPIPPPVLSDREKRRFLIRRSRPTYSKISQRQLIKVSSNLTLNEPIPCNKSLTDLINVVKPKVRQLLEDTNVLKMWIHLMIPSIKDGNNFGVYIQEMVLNKVELVEKFAILLFGYTSICFMARAEILSKVATFPHVSDYRRAVRECDENNYRYMCKMLCQVRDFYCSLHDVVCKNFDRIKYPRTCEVKSMCI